MKNQYLTLGLIMCCVYPGIVWGQNATAQIEQARAIRRNAFLREAGRINACKKRASGMLQEITALQQTTRQRTEDCKSPVSTREQYDVCLKNTKDIFSRTKYLKNDIIQIQKDCAAYLPIGFLAKQLKKPIQKMDIDLHSIGDAGWGFLINSYRKREKTTYDKYKAFNCNLEIGYVTKSIAAQMYNIGIGSNRGDIYRVNKAKNNLKLVEDYVLTMYNVCKKDGFELPEDPKDKKYTQESIVGLKNRVQYVQKTIKDLLDKYGDADFETMTRKACNIITSRKTDDHGLCEAPADTPEWQYSMHRLLYPAKIKTKKE